MPFTVVSGIDLIVAQQVLSDVVVLEGGTVAVVYGSASGTISSAIRLSLSTPNRNRSCWQRTNLECRTSDCDRVHRDARAVERFVSSIIAALRFYSAASK